jgi:hypothetical protein
VTEEIVDRIAEGQKLFDDIMGGETRMVHDRLWEHVYHGIEAFSASGAKLLLRSPAHYFAARMSPREPTPAMVLGSAVHMAILEPERFTEKVFVSEKREEGREKKDEKEARVGKEAMMRDLGNLILTREQHDIACEIQHRAMSHPILPGLLAGARNEVSLLYRDPRLGVRCKTRIDALRSDAICIDVKTTQDASDEAFGRACASFDYHVQAAKYNQAHEVCLDKSLEAFVFVAIETSPPYGIAIYNTPTNVLHRGTVLVNRAMRAYHDALTSGSWPSYEPMIRPLRFPAWALREPTP